MPTTLLRAPRIFRPCDDPVVITYLIFLGKKPRRIAHLHPPHRQIPHQILIPQVPVQVVHRLMIQKRKNGEIRKRRRKKARAKNRIIN